MELRVLNESYAFAGRIDQSACNGCDACGSRCTAGVPMLRAEFVRLREFLESPAGEEARQVEQADKQVPYPGTDDVFYTACRFRDVERGRCSVYPVRPLVCRLFGHVEWLPCPIEKVPPPPPGALPVMRAYVEAGARTYEEWLSEEGP